MALPNFMMTGVAKAGTTSFYRYLDQHPQISMCPKKGTNVFARTSSSWRCCSTGTFRIGSSRAARRRRPSPRWVARH